jgi:hypothetical protein
VPVGIASVPLQAAVDALQARLEELEAAVDAVHAAVAAGRASLDAAACHFVPGGTVIHAEQESGDEQQVIGGAPESAGMPALVEAQDRSAGDVKHQRQVAVEPIATPPAAPRVRPVRRGSFFSDFQ